jgi:hypothetical protein
MRIVITILIFIWTGVWLFIGIGVFLDTPGQIRRDSIFVQTQIKPAVNFVRQFQMDSNKLPSKRQFYIWESKFYKDYSSVLNKPNDSTISDLPYVDYIRDKSSVVDNDAHKFKNADWTKDYAIGVWRGDWMEYYFSWSNSYDTNNYSWVDGFIGLVVCSSIGLLPFIVWLRFNRKKKKSSTQQWVLCKWGRPNKHEHLCYYHQQFGQTECYQQANK